MLTFTVHEPPNPPADRVDRGGEPCFRQGRLLLGRGPVRADVAPRASPVVAAARLYRHERRASSCIKLMTGVDQRWVGLGAARRSIC